LIISPSTRPFQHQHHLQRDRDLCVPCRHVIATISGFLRMGAERSEIWAGWAAGLSVALASNLANNLPVGLVAGSAIQDAHAPARITSAVLIGVDVGPNLSVTGSLATILWLNALRRDGHHIGAMKFLKIGASVMPPALLLAIGVVRRLKPMAGWSPNVPRLPAARALRRARETVAEKPLRRDTRGASAVGAGRLDS
jgi:hypothetical protein